MGGEKEDPVGRPVCSGCAGISMKKRESSQFGLERKMRKRRAKVNVLTRGVRRETTQQQGNVKALLREVKVRFRPSILVEQLSAFAIG